MKPPVGYFSIRPVGLLIVPTAIQSYISIEVQLLAVTVTEALLKTLPSTLKFWSLACVTECRVLSICLPICFRQQFPAPSLPE